MKSPKTKKVVRKSLRPIDLFKEWLKKNSKKGEKLLCERAVDHISFTKESAIFRYYYLPTKKSAGKVGKKKAV